MKNKLTETKLRPGIGSTRHLISGVLCLAVISLICSARVGAEFVYDGWRYHLSVYPRRSPNHFCLRVESCIWFDL